MYKRQANKSENIMYAPSVYTYIINGVPGVYSAQASFNASKGPCAVIYNDGKIKSFSDVYKRQSQQRSLLRKPRAC